MHPIAQSIPPRAEQNDDEQARALRRQRNDALIRMLEEWLADESGYDEETWPELKANLEANRLSYRKRFRD